eukprot:5909468-Prymnesium_polylepis.2
MVFQARHRMFASLACQGVRLRRRPEGARRERAPSPVRDSPKAVAARRAALRRRAAASYSAAMSSKIQKIMTQPIVRRRSPSRQPILSRQRCTTPHAAAAPPNTLQRAVCPGC